QAAEHAHDEREATAREDTGAERAGQLAIRAAQHAALGMRQIGRVEVAEEVRDLPQMLASRPTVGPAVALHAQGLEQHLASPHPGFGAISDHGELGYEAVVATEDPLGAGYEPNASEDEDERNDSENTKERTAHGKVLPSPVTPALSALRRFSEHRQFEHQAPAAFFYGVKARDRLGSACDARKVHLAAGEERPVV